MTPPERTVSRKLPPWGFLSLVDFECSPREEQGKEQRQVKRPADNAERIADHSGRVFVGHLPPHEDRHYQRGFELAHDVSEPSYGLVVWIHRFLLDRFG